MYRVSLPHLTSLRRSSLGSKLHHHFPVDNLGTQNGRDSILYFIHLDASHGNLSAFSHLGFEPLSAQICAISLRSWNSRIYQPLEEDTGPTSPASDSRRIRVVQILLGALVYETKVKINPVDWDTAIYDALSYTWGSYLMLRRVITVNDRTFLVTDSLFRALRQLRHTKETRLVSKSTHLVCVLLASDVPLLLQRSGDNESRVTGQAYVDGIMDYKGDLRQDIESGKIRLREFILR